MAVLSALTLLWLASGSAARAQEEPTATPDAEGFIYAVVQPGDSLWGVAGRAGISLPELLALNEIDEETIIRPGQRLIVGYVLPSPTATAEPPTPTPKPTRPPPTATPTALPPPRTAVCFLAYTDLNQDGIRDEGEPLRAAVAFTLFNKEAVVGNYVTDGFSEPHCLEGLAPGDYQITRSIGREETLTTNGNWSLTLARGQVMNLEFGSYAKGEAIPADGSSTPISGAEIVEMAQPSEDDGGGEAGGRFPGTITAGLFVILVLFVAGGLSLISWTRKTAN